MLVTEPGVHAAHTLVLAEGAQLAVTVHVAAGAVEVQVLAQVGARGWVFF